MKLTQRGGVKIILKSSDEKALFLKRVSNGKDFGWPAGSAAGTAPALEVYPCKLAIQEWTRAWQRCEQDIEVWIELARLEEQDPAEAARLRTTFGSGASDPSPEAEGD